MSQATGGGDGIVRSLVPARMDRLPWSGFHWRVVIALGITWVLEGVEIALASALGEFLSNPNHRAETLHLDASMVGLAGTVYLVGEIVGALYFGRQADKLGRRRLFIVTLALYLAANAVTAFSFAPWFFLMTRFFAGMGIGGEYAAIHSAIDELTPAKYRGRVDIAIAGTYWGGAMIAAAAGMFLLNTKYTPADIGWRIALLLGPIIGLSIWPLRKYIPESPRWQLTHGYEKEAEATVDKIEEDLKAKGVTLDDVNPAHAVVIKKQESPSISTVAKTLFRDYRSRLILGLTLMVTQSFLYNAIFFTYTLILGKVYGVPSGHIAYYFFPFAAGNLIGPFTLGKLFDTVGRRKMIAFTYSASGILLALSAWLFSQGSLTAQTQTILWCIIFFIASAAASSAYLTVSEIFPVEMRAQSISLIFATAQAFGALGSGMFGKLVADATTEKKTITNVDILLPGHDAITVGIVEKIDVVLKNPDPLTMGFVIAAAIMLIGGVVAWFLGVDAEGKSLEDIAPPITAVESPHVTPTDSPTGPHPT
jgi:MFS family permease